MDSFNKFEIYGPWFQIGSWDCEGSNLGENLTLHYSLYERKEV